MAAGFDGLHAVDDREACFLECDHDVGALAERDGDHRAVWRHAGDRSRMNRVVPEGHACDILPRLRKLLMGEVVASMLAIRPLH